MEEIEVKFLNIDIAAIEQKLKAIGATKQGEYFYRRRVFDYPDFRLNAAHSWLRLRDEGGRATLTYKQRLGVSASDGSTNDQSMKEVEVEVSDYEKTGVLLESIGLIEKFYEENKRIRYIKDGVEYDLDTWPQLPPYLEIEADSWDRVDAAARELGLDPADKKVFSTHQIYKLHGIEEFDYQRITFQGLFTKTQAL